MQKLFTWGFWLPCLYAPLFPSHWPTGNSSVPDGHFFSNFSSVVGNFPKNCLRVKMGNNGYFCRIGRELPRSSMQQRFQEKQSAAGECEKSTRHKNLSSGDKGSIFSQEWPSRLEYFSVGLLNYFGLVIELSSKTFGMTPLLLCFQHVLVCPASRIHCQLHGLFWETSVSLELIWRLLSFFVSFGWFDCQHSSKSHKMFFLFISVKCTTWCCLPLNVLALHSKITRGPFDKRESGHVHCCACSHWRPCVGYKLHHAPTIVQLDSGRRSCSASSVNCFVSVVLLNLSLKDIWTFVELDHFINCANSS